MNLKLKEKYILNEKGKKESVILNLKTYEELVEDLEDLYIIAERKNEPSVSIAQLRRGLKKSGIL
jgi:hypothetical protein